MILVVSSNAFAGGDGKHGSGYKNPFGEPGSSQSAPTNEARVSIDGKIQNNSQLYPYISRKSSILRIDESQRYCDFNGNHNSTNVQSEYLCTDFKSKNKLWRVVFGPGVNHGTIARKVFERANNSWVMLAEFDEETKLVSESPSGTKVRIASGYHEQDEPQQANGRENSLPIPNMPNLGTIIDNGIKGIFNKVR